MLAIFLLSCAVQYNDPDPGLWIAYYGYAALVTLLAFTGRYTLLAPIGLLGYLIGFAYYLPGWNLDTVLLLREPKMSNERVELAREAFGLLICAGWMAVLTWKWWRARNADLVN
jgi:hypothetical protein